MNNRERILAILEGRPPDRIPWIPRLLLWYTAKQRAGTLPAKWANATLRDVEHDLGVGTPARNGKVFDVVDDGVETTSRREGIHEITEWHTPVGSLRRVMRHSEELDRLGLPARIDEYPLKGPADYKVWEWIWQHRRWEPAYDAYREALKAEAKPRENGKDTGEDEAAASSEAPPQAPSIKDSSE